jgi:hypothetical protein
MIEKTLENIIEKNIIKIILIIKYNKYNKNHRKI